VSATYLLERAWVDGAVHADVEVTVDRGVFTSVTSPTDSLHFQGVATAEKRRNRRFTGDSDITRIPGLTLPGLANCHSHAFHRALRGRTQRERGTFWTWRDRMYDVAATLDPDSYFTLARATYREMAAAGIAAVGEFHYLHHQPDGTPYDDPNAMGHALVEAAREAGIRIALLDTCYLSSGFGEPVTGTQLRYSDGSAEAWAVRTAQLRRNDSPGVVVGAAIHSVRAVPADQMPAVGDWAREHEAPLHVHLSEQVAENQACVAEYTRTPTELLADHGLLGPDTTAVHATHLTDDDVRLLGASRTHVCFCPTTERDLGDGIGPSRQLHDAGSPLTLGSDSHAVIDLFEEMRAVELDERLATQERGHWSAPELLDAATTHGHASLGFDDAGAIAVGQRADLVTIDTTTPRTAGTGADDSTAVFAATAEDVTQVMVDGRIAVRQGDREQIGRELDAAIAAVWKDVG
jgi:formiminoglutamate deiminase